MVGIYKITNLINGKIYIGQSIQIEERWKKHRIDAFNPKVKNKYKSHLYSSIRKYGIDNFLFEIIEETEQENLDIRERYWIQYYNTTNPEFGYNLTTGGQEGSNNTNTNPIYQYDLDGNFIKSYTSIAIASKITGINKSAISACSNNDANIKFAGGFIWRKYKVNKLDKVPVNFRKTEKIYQYNL